MCYLLNVQCFLIFKTEQCMIQLFVHAHKNFNCGNSHIHIIIHLVWYNYVTEGSGDQTTWPSAISSLASGSALSSWLPALSASQDSLRCLLPACPAKVPPCTSRGCFPPLASGSVSADECTPETQEHFHHQLCPERIKQSTHPVTLYWHSYSYVFKIGEN